MHLEKYYLAWNAYSDHLRNMMREMLNDDFTDVTLVSEDRKYIKAHKNILSACSPIFKDIVKLEHNEKSIIYLREGFKKKKYGNGPKIGRNPPPTMENSRQFFFFF